MLRAVRSLVVPIGLLLLVHAAHAAQAGQLGLLSGIATPSDTAMGSDFPRFPQPALSADGRWVAFSSTAVNLLPGQNAPSPRLNLYLHDRQTGTTALVTHASGSPTVSASGGFSEEYSISDDGRWLVYSCTATDLVAGQVSDLWASQIFLYDRDTGMNTLLSHSIQGSSISSNGLAASPHISGDGNWIVYESAATDLLAGQSDTPGTRDVFLQQRATGLRILVSRATGTSLTAANHSFGQQTDPSVSDNGRYVAFQSSATNLIPGFSPPYPSQNVYLFDRSTHTMTLVSHTSASATTGAGGRQPRISPDGAAVLFGSSANNLVTGQIDPDSSFDRFLFDRASGTNVLVSHAPSSPVTSSGGVLQDETDADVAAGGAWVVFARFVGSIGGQIYLFRRSDATVTLVSRSTASPTQVANSGSGNPRITPDGAFVVFGSGATDLVPGQSGDYGYNAFLFDRAAGTLALASGANGSAQVGSQAYLAEVSDDGSAVAYYTRADNLDAGVADLNNIPDVAIYDRASATPTYATLHAPGQASATPAEDSMLTSASPDGRYAVFLSAGPNIVPGQVDGSSLDVFLSDRTAGTTTLVSHAAGQTLVAGDGFSSDATISADGNYIVFTSNSRNLVPGQIDNNTEEYGEGFELPGTDVFLYDRAAGTTTLVSHAAGSAVTAGNQASLGGASLSADGRYVTFSSTAYDLVPGQIETSHEANVFLYDRIAGTTTLVSRKAGTAATAGNHYSVGARISGDGQWIAFSSEANDLVAGAIDTNFYSDMFLFDRVSGQTLLVSRAAGTPATAADRESWGARLSPDGRYLVFSSASSNLVSGQTGPYRADNVFLFDRVTGTVELISRVAGTATNTVSGAWDGQISDDGHYALFRSNASNLVPGQTAGTGTAKQNIFVHDRVTRQTELISRSVLSPLQTSNHDAQPPTFSPDGRYVAFLSQATDLAPGSTGRDIYLADRQRHTLERVAPGTNSYLYPYNPPSFPRPQLSADGSVVLFTSGARDLADDDFNAADDVFAWTRSGPGTGDFFTVTPCRLIDTRQAGQGPALASGVPAMVNVRGLCGIPAGARAVAVNVTVLQAQGEGRLTLHPGNLSTPNTSTINFQAGQTLANNAMLALASNGEGTLGVTPFVIGGGTVHLVVDVTGWFE